MKKIYLVAVSLLYWFAAFGQTPTGNQWNSYIFEVNDQYWFHIGEAVGAAPDDYKVINSAEGDCNSGNYYDLDLANLNANLAQGQKMVILGETSGGVEMGCGSFGSDDFTVGQFDTDHKVSVSSPSQGAYNTQIDLGWSILASPHTPGENAQGYMVFRTEQNPSATGFTGFDQQPVAITWGDVTQYTDTQLKFGTTYYYTVLAFSVDDTETVWISDFSDPAVGYTAGANFAAIPQNEHENLLKTTISHDVYTGFEQEALYFIITDENGTEVAGVESDFETHLAGGGTSLWEQALQLTGNVVSGGYGTLPSSFTNLSGDWTLEVNFKMDKLTSTLDSRLLELNKRNGSSVYDLHIDRITRELYFENEYFGVYVPLGEWTSLQLTLSGSILTIYQQGVPVWSGGISNDPIPSGICHNQYGVDDMDIGMVRAWDYARTADQIADDYMDLYRDNQNGSLPTGLINEWVMDDPLLADVPGLTGDLLTFTSSDFTNHPLTWVEAFVLADDADIDLTYLHAVEPYSTHDYTLEIFEVGSGQRHTRTAPTGNVSWDPAGTSTSWNNPVFTENAFGLDFTTNLAADRFEFYRQEVDAAGNDLGLEPVYLTTLDMPERSLIDSELGIDGRYQPANVKDNTRGNVSNWAFGDAYAFADESSISGGKHYRYEIKPYYESVEVYGNELTTGTVSTPDLGLNITIHTDELTIAWDATALDTEYGTDQVQISRDGEIIARVSAKSAYTDPWATYGKTHTYGVHPVVDGAMVFGQYLETPGLPANGLVSGWFLDRANDLVLLGVSIEATATVDGEAHSLTLTADQSNGSFAQQHVYYGEEATYTLSGIGNDDFTLTRASHDLVVLAKTDSVAAAIEATDDEFTLSFIEDGAGADNVLSFTATLDGLPANQLAFANLYRNGTLIGIFTGTADGAGHASITLIDRTGTATESYAYEVRAYYITSDGDPQTTEPYLYREANQNGTYPEVTGVTDLAVTETTGDGDATTDDYALKLNWSYTTNAEVDEFRIYRQMEGLEEPTLIGTQSFDAGGSYAFVDYTGIPNKTYTYHVEAVSGTNSTSSNEATRPAYPLYVPTYDGGALYSKAEMTSYVHKSWMKLEIKADGAMQTQRNHDGVAVFGNDGQYTFTEMTYDQFVTDDTDNTKIRYFFPQFDAHVGEDVFYSYQYFKSNEDGTFLIGDPISFDSDRDGIVDTYDADYAATFSAANTIRARSLSVESGSGFYKLNWQGKSFQVTDYHSAKQTASTWILDGETEHKISRNQMSWVGTADNSGQVEVIEKDSEGNVLHTQVANVQVTQNVGIEDFQEIQNFHASQDLRDGVMLTWDYREFSEAGFEIYRNGRLIETVPNTHRYRQYDNLETLDSYWYFDGEPNANEYYAYQVRAVYDEDGDGTDEFYSARATAAGMQRIPFVVEGHVYDDSGQGVPHVQLVIANQWTTTDKNGAYRFDDLYAYDGKNERLRISLGLWGSNWIQTNGPDQYAIQFDANQLVYNHDFTITRTFDGMNKVREVADLYGFTARPDEDALAVHLEWQVSDEDNYDGVEFWRDASTQIADLGKADKSTYTDEGGSPGLGYTYMAVAYKFDATGEKVYGASHSVEVTYPQLLAPGYLVARQENGHVVLQWGDKNTGRSYYILRNDEQIREVTDGTFEYTDRQGPAGENVYYKVYSYLETDELLHVSPDFTRVDIDYPFPATVSGLTATAHTTEGYIEVNWNYPADADLSGLRIERDGVDLELTYNLSQSSGMHQDAEGIPGTMATYDLYTAKASTPDIESYAATVSVMYPDLPAVTGLATHSKAGNNGNNADASLDDMQLKLTWDYQVRMIDGFYITVTDGAGETVDYAWVEAAEGQTAYEHLFEDGVSGNTYNYLIQPRTTRLDTEYFGAEATGLFNFPILPAPVVSLVEQGDKFAYINWTYADLLMDADLWELRVNGTVEANLEAGERTYLIKGQTGQVNIDVTALSDQGANSPAGSLDLTIDSGSASFGISASQGNLNAVDLSLNGATGTSTIYLYRDDEVIAEWTSPPGTSTIWTHTDDDVNPGQHYLYRLVRGGENQAAIGYSSGEDGQVTGRVLSISGGGVSGIALRLIGEFDGRYIIEEAITGSTGQYAFSGLPYEEDNSTFTRYTITPMTPGHLYSKDEVLVELNASYTEVQADPILDKTTVTIAGTIEYDWQRTVAPDMMALLYKYSIADHKWELVEKQETIGGTYSFSPLIDSDYDFFQVYLEANYYADKEGFDYYYSYLPVGSPGAYGQPDDIAADAPRSAEHNITGMTYGDVFEDRYVDELLIPTRFSVASPCGSMGDYRWTVRLQSEDGEVDTYLTTNSSGVLHADLPPLNYKARVTGVDRNTAFTEAVLAYFKAEILEITYKDELLQYTEDEAAANEILGSDYFNTEYDLLFHKVPEIQITGLSADESCAEGTDAGDFKVVAVNDQVGLTFSVQEEFFGVSCDVTMGTLIVLNPGGDKKEVRLHYDGHSQWMRDTNNDLVGDTPYSFTASDVNVVAPYTFLLEAHYFNENGRYLATGMERYIVTGEKNLGDSDFIADPGTEHQWPLFVLRDPPGDKSSSTIKAGSSMSYSYSSKIVTNEKFKETFEGKMTIFSVGVNSSTEFTQDFTQDNDDGYTFKIAFSENVSTGGDATFSVTRKQYQIGREADVIVGLGYTQKYSVVRQIALADDACTIEENLAISVEADEVTTTWMYTVAEIEDTRDYYRHLFDNEEVSIESDNFEKERLSLIADNWQQILDWHDTQNRAPANMCRLMDKIDQDRKDYLGADGDGYWENNGGSSGSTTSATPTLTAFMVDNDLKDDYEVVHGYCRTSTAIQTDELAGYRIVPYSDDDVWTADAFAAYEEAADKFHQVWKAYQVWKLYDASDVEYFEGGWVDTDDIEDLLGAPSQGMVENHTFSAGVGYTNSFSSSKTINMSSTEKQSFGNMTSFGKRTLNVTKMIALVSSTETSRVLNSIEAGGGFVSDFSFSRNFSTTNSLDISYTLEDDDQGDHFNVYVLHDPTGYNYNSSPDFVLTSGKSTCPWEENTLSPFIANFEVMDEQGNQIPTLQHELKPELTYEMPLKLTNLAPYNEDRLWGMMVTPGTKLKGSIDQMIILSSRPVPVYTQGEQPFYNSLYYNNYQQIYDFPDSRIIVAPECQVRDMIQIGLEDPESLADDNKLKSFYEAGIYDFVDLDVRFRKPVSPVAISRAADFFINGEDGHNTWTFDLNEYWTQQQAISFDKIFVEARRMDSSEEEWTQLTDTGGNSDLSYNFLLDYYNEYKTVYPIERYPFVWEPNDTWLDGVYKVRAVSVHKDGELFYSNNVAGNIDRRKPRVENLPEPTDKILSRGDVIGFAMDEECNCDYFYAHPENVNVKVYELDGSAYRTLTYHADADFSEYELRCNGAAFDIIIDEAVLSEVDGKDIEFTVAGIRDLAGNVADQVSWKFRSDFFKYPVSPIILYDPSVVLINAASAEDVPFIMARYELFNNFSVLDSIELQYRKVGTEDYITYGAIMQDELMDNYDIFSPDHSAAPQDTITLAIADIPDGEYNFRFVAWGDGRLRTSNVINGTFDRINPQVMNLAPESRIVDWGDQIRITYSERMYDRDGLNFTAEIVGGNPDGSDLDFTASMQGFINSNWTGFTLNDIDDPVLYAAYGKTLRLTLHNVTDYYGNPLLNNVIDFAIGNFAENVSPIRINNPATWSINGSEDPVTFVVDDYDLYGTKGKDLESIALVYRPQHSNDYTVIASYTQAQLQTIHESDALPYAEPTIEIEWDITGLGLADGDYIVQAVAYGDQGKAFYSNASSGVIDRVSPEYTGDYTPVNGQITANDFFSTARFTETLKQGSGTVTVSQLISGVPVVIADNGTYKLYHDGGEVQVFFTDAFRQLYAGDQIQVAISGVEDAYGNVQSTDVYLDFTMDATYQGAANGRQATVLEGDRMETGEVELTWTSYESFDETVLERSRDGQNFIEIAKYDGYVDRHVDEINFSKLVFYRLKQAGTDGNTFYTKTIALENNNLIPLLATYTYPMPFDGREFRLSVITNNLEDDLEFQIMNTTGRVIATQMVEAEKLNNLNVKISFDDPLKPGIYHMQMVQGEKRSYQKLLVIN